jgi:hypothetical protein
MPQKVTRSNTLTGTARALASAAAKDPKYFYENENIIWCDPTNPNWPQTGNPVGQTCTNLLNQQCSASGGLCVPQQGTCKNVPTCNGVVTEPVAGSSRRLVTVPRVLAMAPLRRRVLAANALAPARRLATARSRPAIPRRRAADCSSNLPASGTQTCQAQTCSARKPAGCNLLPPDP